MPLPRGRGFMFMRVAEYVCDECGRNDDEPEKNLEKEGR